MSGTKHNLCESFPKLRPVAGAEELRLVLEAAEADGHGNMLLPSHVVLKRGKVVGCLSLGTVPVAHCWLHTKELKALDTAMVFAQAENELQRMGFKVVVVPVPESAPLHGAMEKHFGYTSLGNVTLFGKKLK
jgi:hypothetical protein